MVCIGSREVELRAALERQREGKARYIVASLEQRRAMERIQRTAFIEPRSDAPPPWSRLAPSVGPEEHHPDGQVAAEILETVGPARGNEQERAGLESQSIPAVEERAGPPRDDVELVARSPRSARRRGNGQG